MFRRHRLFPHGHGPAIRRKAAVIHCAATGMRFFFRVHFSSSPFYSIGYLLGPSVEAENSASAA
jgi:hypothetical protein